MNASAWVEVGFIMAITLYNQLGTKKINLYRTLVPIAVAVFAGGKYIRAVPMEGSNLTALWLSVLAGVLFGGMLVATTKVGRDSSGAYYTQAGIPYLIVWVLELGSRLAFAEYAKEHPASVGRFFVSHHLSPDIVGTAFLVMTFTMLAVRVGGILVRTRMLPANQAVR